MSSVSYHTNKSRHPILYRSGRITTTLNFTITPNTFYPQATFDVSKINSKKLSIFLFGQPSHRLGDSISLTDFATMPNTVEPFFIDTASTRQAVDSGYQLVGGILSIGVIFRVNGGGTDKVPVSPYWQADIDYFIFYY